MSMSMLSTPTWERGTRGARNRMGEGGLGVVNELCQIQRVPFP